MTATERLQAKWPGLSVRVWLSGLNERWMLSILTFDDPDGEAFSVEPMPGGIATEAEACAAADRALKAIRKAVV